MWNPRLQHLRRSEALLQGVLKTQHAKSNPLVGLGETEAKGGKVKALVRERPLTQRLVGGRLQRRHLEEEGPEDCGVSDVASQSSASSSMKSSARMSSRASAKSKKTNSVRSRWSVDSRIDELRNLQQKQIELEKELINVTQKMTHKYQQKQKTKYSSKAGGKFKEIARQWVDPELSEDGKYQAYMESRYLTQTGLDYHRKNQDKYNLAKHHRKQNIHTKYGNALVKCKIALRGEF